MKRKYLVGIVIGVIGVVAITGGILINLIRGTDLSEDCVVSSFPKYKADTSYIFGFSYNKSGSLPVKLKSVNLVDDKGELIESKDFDWSILKNNDDAINIGAMIYDEGDNLIDYSSLEAFKPQKMEGEEVNLVLKIDSKVDQNKPDNGFIEVEYSVLGINKTIKNPINN